MSAEVLLAEVMAQGVTLIRLGDRLRWRAPAPIGPDLLEQLRLHKDELLALLPEGAPAQPSGPWRIVASAMNLRAAPIRLDAARTVVSDVPAFVESILSKLTIAVEHRNSARATYYEGLIDEWVEELHRCGVEVSVELTQ